MRNKYSPSKFHTSGTPNSLQLGPSFHDEEFFPVDHKIELVGKLAAGLSHEIRNPLTSIKGFVQLLQMGVSQPEFYSTIYSELSKVEETIARLGGLAAPKSMDFQVYDAGELLEQTIIGMQEEFHASRLEVISKFDEMPFPIKCDKEQLQSAFINILKNAVEASEHGQKIYITCEKSDSQIIISFEDNGMGISQRRLACLFEPFYCIKEKGTGFGLMITYKIVKEHLGDISIDSEIGAGTIVTMSFPIFE